MHSIFDKVRKIQGIDIDFFNKVFEDVPDDILDTVQIVRVPKGKRFVVVDEKLDNIRILLSGRVKAMEEYLTGEIFVFSRFDPPEIFGEIEALGNIDTFRASLVTEENSVFVTLPVDVYLEILKENTDLLFERIGTIIRRSSDEQKDTRLYMSIDAKDRIQIYFIRQYRQNSKKDLYTFRVTRQQIADETGYSVKTVNRTIKKLVDEGLITLVGQKFQLTQKQYLKMIDNFAHNTEFSDYYQ